MLLEEVGDDLRNRLLGPGKRDAGVRVGWLNNDVVVLCTTCPVGEGSREGSVAKGEWSVLRLAWLRHPVAEGVRDRPVVPEGFVVGRKAQRQGRGMEG